MKIIRNLFVALLGFIGMTGATQRFKVVKEAANTSAESIADSSYTGTIIADKGKKQTNGNWCRS